MVISTGAAISLLDAVYLPLHLPEVTFRTILYGLPRVTCLQFISTTEKAGLIHIQVGNQAFADYVDTHVTSMNHVNNKKDPVPIVPGRFLGFRHPSGEVHIQVDNVWAACPDESISRISQF